MMEGSTKNGPGILIPLPAALLFRGNVAKVTLRSSKMDLEFSGASRIFSDLPDLPETVHERPLPRAGGKDDGS